MNAEEINCLMDGIYMVCKALVSIVDYECCFYGYREEYDMAETYIKHYEADHMKGESDGKEA